MAEAALVIGSPKSSTRPHHAIIHSKDRKQPRKLDGKHMHPDTYIDEMLVECLVLEHLKHFDGATTCIIVSH